MLWTTLADECGSLLGVADEEAKAKLRAVIARAHIAYEGERWTKVLSGRPKERNALRQLKGALLKAATLSDQLSPEISIAIGALGERASPGKPLTLVEVQNDIARLIVGIEEFLRSFEPGKGPVGKVQLEFAVREVLAPFEDLAGERAKISWNKLSTGVPMPRNAAAQAIVHMISSFEDAPSVVAILNMIQKVQARPGEPETQLNRVMRTHFDELDASLLAGRHDERT